VCQERPAASTLPCQPGRGRVKTRRISHPQRSGGLKPRILRALPMGIDYAVWRKGSSITLSRLPSFLTVDSPARYCRSLRLRPDHTTGGDNRTHHYRMRSLHRNPLTTYHSSLIELSPARPRRPPSMNCKITSHDYIVTTARNRAFPSATRWYAFGASANGCVSTIVLTFPCATKSRAS
jgi:hypothetical protein